MPDTIDPKDLRVLYVEDHDALRDMVSELMWDSGYRWQATATAEEALALFAPGRYDVVVTDVSLPVMSGLELCREIERRAPGTWMIVVSGFAWAQGQGLDKFGKNALALPKPFEIEQLEAALSQVAARLSPVAQPARLG